MLRRTLLAMTLLLAVGLATIKDPRTSPSYLPRHALQCERAATRPDRNKHCKNCNQRAIVGAADSVTVQIGGCSGAPSPLVKVANIGAPSPLVTVANFTATGVYFSTAIAAPSLSIDNVQAVSISTNAISPATGSDLALGGANDTVTVPGNLVVGGTSTHTGLETFNGGIAANVINPATAGSTVTIPGTGQDSTAIGKSGKFCNAFHKN